MLGVFDHIRECRLDFLGVEIPFGPFQRGLGTEGFDALTGSTASLNSVRGLAEQVRGKR